MFARGLLYKRAGIVLGGLMPAEAQTARMFDARSEKEEKLLRAIDEINRRFGRSTVHLAAAQTGRWQMKRKMMSPRYTTRLDEIIRAY